MKLKNNCLTRPLNMVTEMYSLPAYDNVDPQPPHGAVFHPLLRRDDGGYGIRTADDAGLRLCPADIPPEGNDAALLRPAGLVRHQHLCDGRPDRRFLRRFPHPAGPADPPGEHVRPASPVHAAGRHADDSGGRHVPGLCPDPHRHGDQRGREAEARTVPGRVLGGDHLVGGLRRNRAGQCGG